LTVECIISGNVGCQPSNMATESSAAVTAGIRDRRETSGHRDHVITGELVPLDLRWLLWHFILWKASGAQEST